MRVCTLDARVSTTNSAHPFVHNSCMNDHSQKEAIAFAARLKRALEFAQVTGGYRRIAAELQKRGVERCGYTFVGNMLRGDQMPGSKGMIQIATALGVSAEWLMSGRGAMIVQPIDVDLEGLDDEDQQLVRAMIEKLKRPSREKH